MLRRKSKPLFHVESIDEKGEDEGAFKKYISALLLSSNPHCCLQGFVGLSKVL